MDFKTIEDIKELNREIVTEETLETIEESKFVERAENLGQSGTYPDCNWWDIQLTDGSNIDVYIKR